MVILNLISVCVFIILLDIDLSNLALPERKHLLMGLHVLQEVSCVGVLLEML